MYFWEAASTSLAKADLPLVTEYSLYVLLCPVIEAGEVEGVRIKRPPPVWDGGRCRKLITDLQNRNVLAPDSDFSAGVWRFTQTTRSSSAEEACCLVDPFVYVSHLSAMQLYGLTDRSPLTLHLTSPARPIWNALRDSRRERDLIGRHAVTAPQLRKISPHPHVRKRKVAIRSSSHPATPVEQAGSFARVAPIGRVFADMLSEPELCGGIRHVIEIWEREAEQELDRVIEAVEHHPTKLAKVRAGYLLSEHMGLSDPRIEAWQAFAQRGGSQKLDPEAPYEARWSEKWMISLNA
ncbi:MAG: hypothetical protein ACK5SX_00985 [Sandaracinobacter sp.]